MIGDTTHDLQMAINAGAQGLASAMARIRPIRCAMAPVHCATSIADLQEWLLAMPEDCSAPRRLCAADDLADGGACASPVLEAREISAFVVRYDGVATAT
jgi:hypothetical protein